MISILLGLFTVAGLSAMPGLVVLSVRQWRDLILERLLK